MGENTFQVIVNGELVEGFQRDDVIRQVAQLFKTTPDKVVALFSGQQVAVKKGLDAATARKYQQALKAAGLIAHVDGLAPTPATPSALAQASIAAAGETLDRRPAPEAPDIDTSAISIAEPGVTLTQHEAPPTPHIDTSALSLGELGEDVVEHAPVPAPQFDLSAISVAPLGSDIGEKDDTPPPPVPDTSHIRLE